MSFTESGSPGSSPCMACPHPCEMNCLEERHQGSKESYNEREKTALRCMRAEIELSQPQLYGTSYLLVRNTPRGPLLNALPLIRSLAARSFRSRHLPLPSHRTTITRKAYLIPQKFARIRGNVSQFGLPNGVKYVGSSAKLTLLGNPTKLQRRASGKPKRVWEQARHRLTRQPREPG